MMGTNVAKLEYASKSQERTRCAHFRRCLQNETDTGFLTNTPAVTARVVIAEFNLQLCKLSVRELVQGHLGRTDKLAQCVRFAETNLTDHVDELAKFNLAIAARIHFLDQIQNLLLRLVFAQMLQRNSDLGSVDTAK
jgi:hypothetical protein